MLKLYLIWITLNIMVWLAAMNEYIQDITNGFWRILGLSGFFLIFFLLPLLSKKQKTLTILICLNTILSIITVYPLDQEIFNPYILLILALLTSEMAHRLVLSYCIFPAFVQAAGVSLLATKANLPLSFNLFIAMYMIFLFSATALYKLSRDREISANTRYDALLTEYRGLKRRLTNEEELVRQDERILIGHEIHDSVGHKLTALLMQLEALRLKEKDEYNNQKQVQSLKKLAHDSLEETRRAVKTLKHVETGGLQGIIRLIRKLENDSFLRIHFTVNHGAFSAPLNGEQSFVIYRSVQEALTNIMKHSKAREAKVMFEAPGGSMFRFEISNPIKEKEATREGFGLSSMRERLQKIGGDLEIFATAEQFVVRGWIRTSRSGEASD